MTLRKMLLAVSVGVLFSLSACAQVAHRVDLTWNASPDAGVSYNVYRSQVSGSGYVKINTASVTVLNFSDPNVAIGQTYFYVVRAALNGLESVNSNEGQALIVPSAPANVKCNVN